MNIAVNYLQGIWTSRYFWTHLALSDLRSKWRRSFFGMLWSIIQPLGMTLLLSFVFGKIFKTDIREYAPYVLSGILTWEFVSATAIGGSLSFVQADAYIKQYRHPLAIYTLRTTLTNLMVFIVASLGLIGWVLVVMPHNLGWSWLAAALLYPIAACIAWPFATLLAYFSARFRDVPHALALLLQALWFISPVYFEAKVFQAAGLGALVDYNPIYHVLQIVRAPLLEGKWPASEDYMYCIGTSFVLIVLAWLVGRHAEPRVIFYL